MKANLDVLETIAESAGFDGAELNDGETDE